jgi:adenosine deaminase
VIDVFDLPKAELNVHIEGTLEPELVFAIAERNRIHVDYRDVGSLRAAHRFTGLTEFLAVYEHNLRVLREERDYYDLAVAYLRRARAQGVRHAEISFDPQAHTSRGVALETVIQGLCAALADAGPELGMSSHLIMCFQRDQPAQEAMQLLERALAYRDRIIAVGLDSAERGNPPSKFQMVFERARAEGFLVVCAAGEEGPAAYVWEALDLLKAARIGYGISAMNDASLVERLRRQRVPIDVCPVSNVCLGIVPSLARHPLKRMLEAGLIVTCNSDDPAYFGAYAGDNYAAVASALALDEEQIVTLARNSFEASFIDDATRQGYLAGIDAARHPAAE